MYEDEEGNKYFNLPANVTAVLTHEEHKTITLEPATYKVINKNEFDYFEKEMRKVQD